MEVKKNIFSFSVSTYGLRGDAFALGTVSMEIVSGKILREKKVVKPFHTDKCSKEDLFWIVRNLPDSLLTAPSEKTGEASPDLGAILQEEITKGRDSSYIVVNNPNYVLTHFLIRNKILINPLLDLQTILFTERGLPELRTSAELPQHDPLCDAIYTARLFRDFMLSLPRKPFEEEEEEKMFENKRKKEIMNLF